jgi:hypothetical protein
MLITIDYTRLLLMRRFTEGVADKEDVERQISEAEVMTALFVGGKHKMACDFLQEQKYIPQMIRKSQFSRWLRSVHYCW